MLRLARPHDGQVHGDFRNQDRMAEWDEVRRSLCRHDASNPRNSHHVALLGRVLSDQLDGRLVGKDDGADSLGRPL